MCVAGVSTESAAQAPRLPRAEAGLSMMMSPSADSRIPELMVGPMVNITLGEAAGGVIGLEGAMRFRADGQQLLVCPQPPGVICDARNVKTLGTAGLTFRRGFGAQPMRQGAIMRAGIGGAFSSLKGTATIFPNTDGSRPALEEIQKSAAFADVGLGWIQRLGSVPLRIEGRVTGFAPELAATRYTYGLQFGLGY
jgi:hypothetical protein